jgi:glycosyltransferase involved in cell wall biosynthesis
MPCLNEAETLEVCIQKANRFLKEYNVSGEVLIADNGSTDGSLQIASLNGARIINIPEKGYGAALIGGINSANGKYIIMGDSDDSYDFSKLEPFMEKLRLGYDLVMGNRFKGGIQPNAMPFLHKYLGNPVLSFLGRLFFNSKVGDFHCGLRGFSKSAALKLDLACTGMEFASEMIVKASLLNLNITEVPTTLSPDGRTRPPHLRTWKDGWRHLRFLLMYSPRWLFLYPGTLLMILGFTLVTLLSISAIRIGNINLDIHTLMFGYSFIFIGFQGISFFMISRLYASRNELLPDNKFSSVLKNENLPDLSMLFGAVLTILGIVISYYSFTYWKSRHFGNLNPSNTFRMVLPGIFSILLGINFVIYGFFMGIINLKFRKKNQ